MGEYAEEAISRDFEGYISQFNAIDNYEFDPIDGKVLRIYNKKQKNSSDNLYAGLVLEGVVCPDCGSPIVVRQNSKTKEYFGGCIKFPQCKVTYNL